MEVFNVIYERAKYDFDVYVEVTTCKDYETARQVFKERENQILHGTSADFSAEGYNVISNQDYLHITNDETPEYYEKLTICSQQVI
jgi:hypothetical protein